MSKIYSILFLLFFVVSCTQDFNMETDDSVKTSSNYNYGNAVQRNFHGIILDTDGVPISGATVVIGGKTSQTNEDGLFIIKEASVKENFAFLKVTKQGFVNGSRTIIPTSGSNKINIMMIPVTNTATITSGAESTVSLPNGTKVKFDGSFKDDTGVPYSGNVNVALFHLTPSDTYLNELMPGSLLANNIAGEAKIMETFGMLHVQLTGAAGQNLQIEKGHQAEITLAIDAAQMGNSPTTIPLWSFDEITGMWKEEGSASKVGNTYVGNVNHFSWWNCDVPMNFSQLKLNLKSPDGEPLSNVQVGLKLPSMAYEMFQSTDNTGMAAGFVPANETIELKIYNACNNTVYSSNIGPFTASITTVLPDIVIPVSSANSIIINGGLKSCSGSDVTNGFVVLNNPNASNYFNSISLVNNGAFSFSILGCAIGTPMKVTGYDLDAMQNSGEIYFNTSSPITNLGNISTCNSVSEFVNYQIDTEPVQYCITNFEAGVQNNNLVINHIIGTTGGQSYFRLEGDNIYTVGTYTSGFTVYTTSPNSPIAAQGNNLTLQINHIGSAAGDYIDFTINGTYLDPTTTTPITRTINVTGHVKRDN